MAALHEEGLVDRIRMVRTTVDPLIPLQGFLPVDPPDKTQDWIPTAPRRPQNPLILEWADAPDRS